MSKIKKSIMSKLKKSIILELCVMSVTHLLSIPMGFRSNRSIQYWCRRQRVLMMTQVKTTYSFINHSTCEVTDSMSTNCKMTCGLKPLTLADSEVITGRMPVLKMQSA